MVRGVGPPARSSCQLNEAGTLLTVARDPTRHADAFELGRSGDLEGFRGVAGEGEVEHEAGVCGTRELVRLRKSGADEFQGRTGQDFDRRRHRTL